MSRGSRRGLAISVLPQVMMAGGRRGRVQSLGSREVGTPTFQVSLSPVQASPPPLKLEGVEVELGPRACTELIVCGSCETQAELIIKRQGDTLHPSQLPSACSSSWHDAFWGPFQSCHGTSSYISSQLTIPEVVLPKGTCSVLASQM